MEDENIDDLYDQLPFEEQMKFEQTKRNLESMMPHIEEMGERLAQYMQVLQACEDNTGNQTALRKILFEAAEKFEKFKPLPTGDGLPKEEAKEFDWLRLVADEKPEMMEFAVDTLRTCVGGDFDGAHRKFYAVINVRPDEFEAIINYWKEALED